MKKEIKKKKTIKKTKNDWRKDPNIDLTLGALLICGNDFHSEIFIEKLIVILGLILLIESTYRLYVTAKNEKQKSKYFYGTLCIIFTIAIVGLLLSTLII